MKIKKYALVGAALAFALTLTVAGFASANNGPEVIEMTSAAAKKPATFPHKKHQEDLKIACAECHHTMTADGKQGPYEAGKEAKCESCHDGVKVTNAKVDSLMKAAHENCKGCHKEKNGPSKCGDCHKK